MWPETSVDGIVTLQRQCSGCIQLLLQWPSSPPVWDIFLCQDSIQKLGVMQAGASVGHSGTGLWAWLDSGHRCLLPLASKQDLSGQWAHWAAANAVGGLGLWVMLVGSTSSVVRWQLPVLCTGHWGPGRTKHQLLARLPRILTLGIGKPCTCLDTEPEAQEDKMGHSGAQHQGSQASGVGSCVTAGQLLLSLQATLLLCSTCLCPCISSAHTAENKEEKTT